MLIPTHTFLAKGQGNKIVVEQNLQDLSYGTWLLGLDSLSVVNVGKIDSLVKLSSTLVQKNIGCFLGQQDSLEVLEVFYILNSSSTLKKTIKLSANYQKLFHINNIGHNITFIFDPLSGEIPTDCQTILYFSLYKTK
jgi:hypothetical protein